MVDVFHFLITCNKLSLCSCASLLVLIFQVDNGWQKKTHLNILTLWPYHELNCCHECMMEIFFNTLKIKMYATRRLCCALVILVFNIAEIMNLTFW